MLLKIGNRVINLDHVAAADFSPPEENQKAILRVYFQQTAHKNQPEVQLHDLEATALWDKLCSIAESLDSNR